MILIRPYEEYIEEFNKWLARLYAIAPTPQAVDELIREDDQLDYVQAFRGMMRALNVLKSFTEFTWNQLDADPQEFEDYKSKYLDIYDRHRKNPDDGAYTIIDDVDFELELIHRDEINVAYILNLLARLHRSREDVSPAQYEESKKAIMALLGQETQLRSKRELIERFINEHLPKLEETAVIEEQFVAYWTAEEEATLNALCTTENMNRAALDALMKRYRFTGKVPLRDDIFSALNFQPKILERKTIYDRIVDKLQELIQI